jgi:hypothetical protein
MSDREVARIDAAEREIDRVAEKCRRQFGSEEAQEFERSLRCAERERQADQQAALASLEQEHRQALERDLNEEAAYSHSGERGRRPKPQAPEIARALEAARHNFEVTSRAVIMASAEVSRYHAENATRLMEKVREAKQRTAQEIAELARPLADALHRYQLPEQDARVLRPYLEGPAQENTGQPENLTTIVGPLRTSNFGGERVGGLTIGQLEAVITELSGLAARGEDNVTVVGPTPEETEDGEARESA